MKTKDAIEYFRTPTLLARALRIKPQAVNGWKEYPPVGRQYQIQVLSDGKLKADDVGDLLRSRTKGAA